VDPTTDQDRGSGQRDRRPWSSRSVPVLASLRSEEQVSQQKSAVNGS